MPNFTPVQLELYKQGSKSCRNYSPLTQRTRTLALIAAVAAVAAPLSNLVDLNAVSQVLLPAGIVLMVIAVSLGLVDWHYQSAFQAIRDVLALLEASVGERGPWIAHFDARGSWRDFIASYMPFGLLFAVGAFTAGTPISTDGCFAWGEVDTWAWFVLGGELLVGLVGTAMSMLKHHKDKVKIYGLLDRTRLDMN